MAEGEATVVEAEQGVPEVCPASLEQPYGDVVGPWRGASDADGVPFYLLKGNGAGPGQVAGAGPVLAKGPQGGHLLR